jgi:hypothetical protein
MKEKTTAFITLGCIFSLFFYYKIYSTDSTNVAKVENTKSTEQVVQELVEKINSNNDPVQISDSPNVDSKKDLECILGQQETDQMSFSESFKYHRECNGKGSMFSWKGSEYSTLLASEVIPQKTPVAEKPVKSIDKHHLALQQEILGTTVGSK